MERQRVACGPDGHFVAPLCRTPRRIRFVALLAGVIWADGTARTDAETVGTKLIGTWVGVSGHWGNENPPPETRSFTFTENHQFKATIAETTIVGTYRIDTSKKPFQIDFTFDLKDEKVTTLTIFDFPRDNQIWIAEWDPSGRRKEFNPGITFRRQKYWQLKW